MEVKTFKIFSYCKLKEQEEENYETTEVDDGLEEYSCNCYVPYTANTEETLKKQGYGNDLIANLLIKLGASENEEVLIEMDY